MPDPVDPVELRTPGPGRIALAGMLTFGNVGELWRRSAEVLGAAAEGRLEIDLGGITRADSAGLALLVSWLAAARERGIELGYAGVPARLRAIAHISEVDALLGGNGAAAA